MPISTASWKPLPHGPAGDAAFQHGKNQGRPSSGCIASVVTAQTFGYSSTSTAVTPKSMRRGAFEPANVSQHSSSSPSAVSFASNAPSTDPLGVHPTGCGRCSRDSSPSECPFPNNEMQLEHQVNDPTGIPAQNRSRYTPRSAQTRSENAFLRDCQRPSDSNSAQHRTSIDIESEAIPSSEKPQWDETEADATHATSVNNDIAIAANATTPLSHQRRRRHVDLVWNVDGTPLLDHNNTAITVDKFLATKPLKADLSTRPGPGNRKLTYMSGEAVTRTLNEVFGYDGWCLDIKSTNREENWKDEQGRHHVSYTATVRLTLRQSGAYKEDCGAGDAIDKVFGTAVANALKASVTDAMKRAARHFGEKLGNSLYQGSFNVNKAPMTLKDALDRFDIEQANSKFGFRSKRKAAPGASGNTTERDRAGSNGEQLRTKRPHIDSSSAPLTNRSEDPKKHTSSNSTNEPNRYASRSAHSNGFALNQNVPPNTTCENETASLNPPNVPRDPYNRDKTHNTDVRSRPTQSGRSDDDQPSSGLARQPGGSLGDGPDLTVFSAIAPQGPPAPASKSSHEANRNANASPEKGYRAMNNQGQPPPSETEVPADFFDFPRPPTSRGRREPGSSLSRPPRNCGEEAPRTVPTFNPYQSGNN